MSTLILILLFIIFLLSWGLVSLLGSYFNFEIYDQTHAEYTGLSEKSRNIHFILLILEGPFVFLRLLKKK
jgi:ABC-type Mn2+/Zn2+ transport system permease subunit